MSSLRINECIHWLWAASRGFRLSVVYCTLAGVFNVSVSLFFVFVCKHLIDIATGVSDDSLGTYIGWMAATERLTELTSLPLERQGKSVRLTGNLGIRISHVRFSYSDSGREVLAGFSHDFRPGSLTVIVGETGVGKSTLIKLILALVQPKEGNIVIYNEHTQNRNQIYTVISIVSSVTPCFCSHSKSGVNTPYLCLKILPESSIILGKILSL